MAVRFLNYFFIILLLLPACKARNGKAVSEPIEKGDTGIIYAKRFNISKKEGYSILTVVNPCRVRLM